MIHVTPFENLAVLAVFRDLDANDWLEAMLARGAECDHLQLWAEWWAAQPYAAQSLVLRNGAHRPFAVLMVAHVPGQRGVSQAALLSRSHYRFGRDLARASVQIARDMPDWAGAAGIHRIEARSWAGHPSAGRFLSRCGFQIEATLPGFGPGGAAVFHQYAWVRPSNTGGTEHV